MNNKMWFVYVGEEDEEVEIMDELLKELSDEIEDFDKSKPISCNGVNIIAYNLSCTEETFNLIAKRTTGTMLNLV